MQNCYVYYVGYSGFKADKSGGYITKNGIKIEGDNVLQMDIDTDTMMFNKIGQLQAKTQLIAGDAITIDNGGIISVSLSANETLKFVSDTTASPSESTKLRLAGNYKGVQGINIDGNIISADVDGTTVRIINGKLTSTQQFQAGDGIKIIEKFLDPENPDLATRYLSLHIDEKTLVYDENRNLKGNYQTVAPLSFTGSGNIITLNYDSAAFQLIDDPVTKQKILSLKQLFSQGQGIRIAPDTIDTTKQKISVAVDGTTVKIVNDVLVSQKLTPLDGGVVKISDDNKISVGYDNITIKNISGKLTSGLSTLQPLKITNSTQIELDYDTNTLTLVNGLLSARQGIITAGTGISVTPGDNSTTIVSANIDNNTIIVDSATKKLKTHYNFTKPLTYDTTTGKVTLSIDDVTLKVVNNKLTGNYSGNNGINITNGIISAIVDDDTMKINGIGQLYSTQLFKEGKGVKFTKESDGNTYLGLNVDNVTLTLSDTGVLQGNYQASAPLSLTQNVVSLDYDENAFQLIDNATTGKKVLSLKQLFSAGGAISISADTNDTTKQKISVEVDGTTVKISGNKLISQLITPVSGSTISISADHKISVGYDNVTIKNVGGQLASGLTVAQPLKLTNSTQIGLSYDTNTLSVSNIGVLSAKQGAVSAGTGINISTDSNAITTISAKIDGTTIVVDSATKKLKANYTFMAPLSYNSSTGAVTVGYDNSTIILSSNKLAGNYKAGNGVTITTNTIAAKIDDDTIKFNKNGQLTTSYLFKQGGGVLFTSASDGGNYLGLNVDGTTMIISDKQLKGNYKVTAPLTLTGSTIGLNYDTDAFQITGGNKLSLKQIFSAGDGIKIAADTTDSTKQKISINVDGTSVKFNGGKLTVQKLTPATGSPIVIDSENKISVSVDDITVKVDDTGKKLKGNYTATAPIILSAGSATTQPSFTLGYDSNTLQITSNKLQAKQGQIIAGTGISASQNSTTKATTISLKVDGTSIKFNGGKLTANYIFNYPLLRDTSTGAVNLQYDSTTLKIVSNKLTGNYKATGAIKLDTATATYSLNYDTDKFKLDASNNLTTIDPVIRTDKGLSITTSTDSTTKVKTYTLSANIDNTTLMFDADKRITVKYPATVYYYPFTLKAYSSVEAGRTAVNDATAEFETLYLISGSTYRSMLFAGEYVDLDSNQNFVRRVNNIMGYNFKGIDYRATCTATSFGTLCRNKEVAHNITYKSVNLSKMKLQNIFIDVPDTSTKTNTITFPDELTFGISTIFVQLSTFTSTLTFTADKAKNIGVYGTVSSPLQIGQEKYVDYYDGAKQ